MIYLERIDTKTCKLVQRCKYIETCAMKKTNIFCSNLIVY